MSIFKIRGFVGLAGYYRRFENGLKLSIRDRIVGLRLRDTDSMVGTALTIEREIENARSTRDTGLSSKRGSAFSQFGEEAEDFCFTLILGLGLGFSMRKTGIPRLWENAVLVSCRTGSIQFIPPHPSEG